MSAAHLQHPAGPLKYRPDVDGLRALAVLSVVVYHAFPHALPGGFIGVDLFFVISGFLISKIILGGLADGRFTFREFYARRVRRIFPALVVVLTACAVLGWFVLTPTDYRTLGTHIAGGAGFASNLILWSESGYFDSAAELKPLLHLWSLGVEEQFYIVWPLALWLCFKARLKPWVPILAIGLASFVLNLWMVRVDLSGAFYSPLTRFWELLAGAMLAHLSLQSEKRSGADDASPIGARANALSIAGLACVVAGLVLLDRTVEFPGAWALLPTVGGFLLIAAGPSGWVNRNVLSRPAVVFIGLISYPLYLWHWPLLAFARVAASGEPAPWLRAALMGLAVLLAWLTYRFVELPLRFGARRRNVFALGTAMASVALVGGVTFATQGFQGRFKDDIGQYANYSYDFRLDARVSQCWLSKQDAPDGFAAQCVDPPSRRPMLVLWGDSHAARLYPGLRKVAGDRLDLAQFTRDSCAPVLGWGYENCMRGNAYVLSRVQQLRPETVVLFAYWNSHMANAPDAVMGQIGVTVSELKKAGVGTVIVVGPAPQWNTPLPNNIVQLMKTQHLERAPRRTAFGLNPAVAEVDSRLRAKLAGRDDLIYVSAFDAMCDDDGCLARTGDTADTLTSWDYGHLTTPGAVFLARAMSNASNGFR
jgi:peptidoglycan/LPS O-acetylase OafA/YrhL